MRLIKLLKDYKFYANKLVAVTCIILCAVFVNNDVVGEEKMFTIEKIPKTLESDMKQKNIWNESCPVPMERLRLLHLSYFDFNGKEHHHGQMIVMDIAAVSVIKIFKHLHAAHFPIDKIKLINDYNGDDEASMADNNSSAFNCRKIVGTDEMSIHSYGLAIDINPVQNPYINPNKSPESNLKNNAEIFPAQGTLYLNRTNIRAGMVESNLHAHYKNVIEIFKKHGFHVWGGNWNAPLDWHHFQLTRAEVDMLAIMPRNEAQRLFDKIVDTQNIR